MENEKKKETTVVSKILTGLLSVVIAFGLWLYVVTVVSPESEDTFYNIPIILQNEGELEKRGLMITNDELPTVSLRLSGNRTDLQKLNNSNISVYVDLSKYDNNALEYTVVFPGDVPNNAITTQKRTPDKIKLKVEAKGSKDLKLQPVYTGNPAEDFSVDKENAQFDYENFRVEGPKRIVDMVAAIRVGVDLKDRKESIENSQLTYSLVDASGQKVDSDKLRVYGIPDDENEEPEELEGSINLLQLRISKIKTIQVAVTIVPGGGATEENSEIVIQPESITVSGTEEVIDKLGDVLTVGEINLGEYPNDTQVKLPLQLPEGVVCESGETEILVDLRFPNLLTKALNVRNITSVNVPAGMVADVVAKVIEIRFRGPKDLIASLTASDAEVIVDFTGAQPGTETRQVTVKLGDKYVTVGAVGTYSVQTTVKAGG